MTFPWETISEQLQIGKWKRFNVRALPETIYSSVMEAYLSCSFGNDEPPLIRMGEGFHASLLARLVHSRPESAQETGNLSIFMGARVIQEERGFPTWEAHLYMWDRISYDLPILFVAATVELVDGA
jgi:hypothetical protein